MKNYIELYGYSISKGKHYVDLYEYSRINVIEKRKKNLDLFRYSRIRRKDLYWFVRILRNPGKNIFVCSDTQEFRGKNNNLYGY